MIAHPGHSVGTNVRALALAAGAIFRPSPLWTGNYGAGRRQCVSPGYSDAASD